MARIPVEKRGGGFPWWAWLLIGLLLLALIWLLFSRLGGGEDRVAAPAEPTEISAAVDGEPTLEPADGVPAAPALGTPTPVTEDSDPAEVATVIAEVTPPPVLQQTPVVLGTETPGGTSGPITDLTTILEEQDKASLAGRRVDLRGETAAQVRSVVGDATFWVGPSADQQVFVVLEEEQDAAGAEGRVDVNEGQTLRITGEVSNLPHIDEARQQWGLSEANAAELENQPIYISAEQVEIIER